VLIDTGEELLAAALGDESVLARAAQSIEPFIVPYDQLARVDGWAVWLGHPPVPDGFPLLPAPGHLMWDEPEVALAAAAAVAADYSARRGADSAQAMVEILVRESPVAIVVPGELAAGLRALLGEVGELGVPVLERPVDVDKSLSSVPSFARRREAHRREIGRLHDPALSFQHFVTSGRIGGDARSTFVLHNEGERDNLSVTGVLGGPIGIEVGVGGPGITVEATEALERQAAKMPSFLNGVMSRVASDSLEIGWRLDAEPSPMELGEVFRIWLKALHGVELVDVRIVLAPPHERSALLTEMNSRAERFKRRRAATIAGDED
jgi:hypothetical protein